MPNKIKKTNKREEELKALGIYPENPDETLDPLEEIDSLDAVFSPEETDSEDDSEEE